MKPNFKYSYSPIMWFHNLKCSLYRRKGSALSAPSGISYAIPVKHANALLKKKFVALFSIKS
ncbi:hypothetical protein BM526_12785 [Alteromonas mediterranea]|nr:hypothetical protein BM526_12785 [Alteromonas mediterranea]